jgi:C-terminal region of band_7
LVYGTLLQALNEANGNAAASLAVAEKYVTAFGELAKETTCIIHMD